VATIIAAINSGAIAFRVLAISSSLHIRRGVIYHARFTVKGAMNCAPTTPRLLPTSTTGVSPAAAVGRYLRLSHLQLLPLALPPFPCQQEQADDDAQVEAEPDAESIHAQMYGQDVGGERTDDGDSSDGDP